MGLHPFLNRILHVLLHVDCCSTINLFRPSICSDLEGNPTKKLIFGEASHTNVKHNKQQCLIINVCLAISLSLLSVVQTFGAFASIHLFTASFAIESFLDTHSFFWWANLIS